jgi:hypothetical protein
MRGKDLSVDQSLVGLTDLSDSNPNLPTPTFQPQPKGRFVVFDFVVFDFVTSVFIDVTISPIFSDVEYSYCP